MPFTICLLNSQLVWIDCAIWKANRKRLGTQDFDFLDFHGIESFTTRGEKKQIYAPNISCIIIFFAVDKSVFPQYRYSGIQSLVGVAPSDYRKFVILNIEQMYLHNRLLNQSNMYASVGLNKFATLDSGIDVGQGINVGSGIFVKKQNLE